MKKLFLLKLATKVNLFRNRPNIRLRLTLKSKKIEKNLCEELSKELKLDYDFSEPELKVGHKFHKFTWDIHVDMKIFKRSLAKYQNKKPNLDISFEKLGGLKPVIIQLVGTVIVTVIVTIIITHLVSILKIINDQLSKLLYP